MRNNVVIIFIGFFLILGVIFAMQTPVNLSYITNSQVETITFEHQQVHKGEMWSIYNYTVLGNGDTEYLLFYTGNKSVHLIFQLTNEVEAQFTFCENVSVVNNGTKLTYFNRNRNFIGENGVSAYLTDTISACDVLFGSSRFGDKNQFGGRDRSINEYVLRKNTIYALRVDNLATTDNTINFYLEWYEGDFI